MAKISAARSKGKTAEEDREPAVMGKSPVSRSKGKNDEDNRKPSSNSKAKKGEEKNLGLDFEGQV